MHKNFLDGVPEAFVSNTAMSASVSKAAALGLVRRIGPKLYTRNLDDAPEQIVARNLWSLVGALLPGALVADRTAMATGPAADGSLFLVCDRRRDIKLPGLVIRPRRGAGPQPGDKPFAGGLFFSSSARAFLDNMEPSRRGKGGAASRTLSHKEIETRLDDIARIQGKAALDIIHDEARLIAPAIGREQAFTALDRLIGTILRNREDELAGNRAKAPSASRPYDPDRVALFQALHRELRDSAPVVRAAPALGKDGQASLVFFEAFFSNFIEGTKFDVGEAADIVFHAIMPTGRPEDAHDVLRTWRIVSDPVEMSQTPADAAALQTLLKRRHAILMSAHPEKNPGIFKDRPNRAGATSFVAADQVEGTLEKGMEFYHSLETAFARAVYMTFLVLEVHPFTDGNGRAARIMMNAELVQAGEARILVPIVYRNHYASGLKTLSRTGSAESLVRTLDFAQRWSAAIPWGSLGESWALLERSNAFADPAEAREAGIRLRIPADVAGASGENDGRGKV